MSIDSEIERVIGSNDLAVTIATGTPLDPRKFSVRQAMSELFQIEVTAVSTELDLDLDGAIGLDASFSIHQGTAAVRWSGICKELEQIRVESAGLATYRLVLVPSLWKLTQRTNYRIFQFMSELSIVSKILGEWGITFESRTDGGRHKPRKYRVQYAESDFDFVARMLEDAGISFYFESGDGGSVLVLDDAPETREASDLGLRFYDEPGLTDARFATNLAARSRLRPGAMTIGDVDYRLPSTRQPRLGATGGLPQESALEQFDFDPGAFLYQGSASGKTPFADDRGASRTDEGAGNQKVQNRLAGHRGEARKVTFESNVLDLAPGRILSILDHPHSLVAASAGLLVVGASIDGEHWAQWRVKVESAPTSQPWRPAAVTPKPRARGIESATVVGPKAEEIHTDEYGRIRVHFHWDRESKRNEASSCWLPTSQPWAGDGYGGVNLPRVGQEVLVGFLAGDPDRPVVIGRVYTETNPVPDPLPQYKHVAGLFTESTPRLVMGGATGSSAFPDKGIFGGAPMTPEEMNANATSSGPLQVVSPTGTNHTWKGSGLKLDDMSGAENLYVQANRDMHWIVENNWTTVVGAHRTARIGTDDITWVDKNQSVFIGNNQDTLVQKSQATHVEGKRTDIVGKCFKQTGNVNLRIESQDESVSVFAKGAIELDAKVTIEFRVSKSVVKIQKNMIAASAENNRVSLNPSQAADTAESKERREKESRAKAAEAAIYSLWPWNRGNDTKVRAAMSNAGVTDKGEQDAAIQKYNDSFATDGPDFGSAM